MQKTVSLDVQKFIPSVERKADKPTAIYCKPMSKGAYDKFLASLTEIKKNKVVSHHERSTEFLFEQCLAANAKGVYLENVEIDGKEYGEVSDKSLAVKFLLGMKDIECANEIEQFMRGQSTLDEDEVKN